MEELRSHPLETTSKYLKIGAPMVRYSKLPFRDLIRNHAADFCYSPMILADVFTNSHVSRRLEFKTYQNENVVVQFAAVDAHHAAAAAELVARHSSGVDINCGCPQKWAIHEGIGAALMQSPETVADIVSKVKSRTSCVKMSNGKSFPCSIKIRIHDSVNTTIELAKRAEKMGVDWITVHGRTVRQKNTEEVNWESIKLIKESVNIPIIYNGDSNQSFG
jgi:tRNA-dihydrouridine synthase 4